MEFVIPALSRCRHDVIPALSPAVIPALVARG